nr:hypothetical protein [Tanacetum cinerariifolium]
MQALKDSIKHQQLSMDDLHLLCVIKNVKMIKDVGESSQTKKNADKVNQRDKNKGRNRINIRRIISLEPEHVYDEMIEAKADMDVIDDEETNTDAENINKSSSDSLLGMTMDYQSEKSNLHTRSEVLIKTATCNIPEDPLEEPKEMTTIGDDLSKKSDPVVFAEDPVDIDADTPQQIPRSQLKQSLFNAMLKDPKLREQDKALFELLSKGADVLKPGKDTCIMDNLRKRSYDDPDHDYHEGEKARSRKPLKKGCRIQQRCSVWHSSLSRDLKGVSTSTKCTFPNDKMYYKLKIKEVVKVKDQNDFGYRFLEEIMVILINDNEYTLYEADFKKLHIDDIALLIFIRSAMIMLRVKDLQLGLESYQKRFNIKRPKLTLD